MATMPGDFIVHFTFNNAPRRVTTPSHEPWSMADIKDGFWLTSDMRICRESQGMIWIPPSQLLMIERPLAPQ